MSLIVKICGLSTRETLDVALDAGAEMVGFVFFPPSPRHLSLEIARDLGKAAKRRASKVALTVDADDLVLAQVIDALKPDMLQLHGHETPERVGAVRQRFGLPVIKALPVETKDDLAAIKVYSDVSDMILFDARPPRGATRPGGLGRPFDWSLLRGLVPGQPFILSGGLNAQNVAEALMITKLPAVDVSSGVERAPGEKDLDKIREFIQVARAAYARLPNALHGMSA